MVTEMLAYHRKLRKSEIDRGRDIPVLAIDLVVGALVNDRQTAEADDLVRMLWEDTCLAGSFLGQRRLGRWPRSCMERSSV